MRLKRQSKNMFAMVHATRTYFEKCVLRDSIILWKILLQLKLCYSSTCKSLRRDLGDQDSYAACWTTVAGKPAKVTSFWRIGLKNSLPSSSSKGLLTNKIVVFGPMSKQWHHKNCRCTPKKILFDVVYRQTELSARRRNSD